jgi:tRNA (adenine37-N6)-methyltransferase
MTDPHIHIEPIGVFHTDTKEKHRVPRQPDKDLGIHGYILLQKEHNYEQAIQDLVSFSHIWIIFQFHQALQWKPMVLPPRGKQKRGVFATRSPYRPNPIGISVVSLISINGLCIEISGTDLLDETPILDIKPYIPYADCISEANSGWLDAIEEPNIIYNINDDCMVIASEIKEKKGVDIILHIKQLLRESPYPHPYRRIKKINENMYELSVRTWRIVYTVLEHDESMIITILSISYLVL